MNSEDLEIASQRAELRTSELAGCSSFVVSRRFSPLVSPAWDGLFEVLPFRWLVGYMDVSKNRGVSPQIIHGFPLFSPSILGVLPLFLETPICFLFDDDFFCPVFVLKKKTNFNWDQEMGLSFFWGGSKVDV